jgi:protease PrsW
MIKLLALAIAPGLAISIYIYWKDKFDKEPRRLLLLAFFLGVLSTIPAVILETAFSTLGLERSGSNIAIGVYAFVGVAAVEELCKFFFVFRFLYRHKEFDEPFDGITYAVMVSMGFATLENVIYTFEHGATTGILRMFTAVPAHATFAIMMGYFLGLAKFRQGDSNLLIAYAVLVPILFHGLYDFALMQQSFKEIGFMGALASLILGIILSISAIRIHQRNSPFKRE